MQKKYKLRSDSSRQSVSYNFKSNGKSYHRRLNLISKLHEESVTYSFNDLVVLEKAVDSNVFVIEHTWYQHTRIFCIHSLPSVAYTFTISF